MLKSIIFIHYHVLEAPPCFAAGVLPRIYTLLSHTGSSLQAQQTIVPPVVCRSCSPSEMPPRRYSNSGGWLVGARRPLFVVGVVPLASVDGHTD